MITAGVKRCSRFLMQRDLSKSNLLAPPRGAARLEQIVRSINPLEKWWYWRLQEGSLFDDYNEEHAADAEDGEWPAFVATDSALNYFTAYCRAQLIRTAQTEPTQFSIEWRALLPGNPKTFKKRASVRGADGNRRFLGQPRTKRQPWGVTLPPLNACAKSSRSVWDKRSRGTKTGTTGNAL